MDEFRRVTLYRIKDDPNGEPITTIDLDRFDRIEIAEPTAVALVRFDEIRGKDKSQDDFPWLRLINAAHPDKPYTFRGQNKFPRAAMFMNFEVGDGANVTYAAAFGLGADSLINRRAITYDFGIRVAMNICDVDKLRRIQTTAHEAVSRQTERQASIGTSLDVFGVNTDVEFLRMLSGIVSPAFVDKIESFRGKESIALKVPKDKIPDLPALVKLCQILEERYQSDDYKNTPLRVYDRLKVVNDPVLRDALDKEVASLIENKVLDKIHLAPPDFIEGDDVQYAYKSVEGDETPELYDDLRIEDLLAVPRRRLKGMTAATIKSWPIFRYDDQAGKLYRAWSAYRCLVAELDHGGKTYVLSNGQWREISEDLKKMVDDYFDENDVKKDWPFLPINVNIYDAVKDQFREEIFNKKVANTDPNIYLFDKSKVQIAGKKLYEICDLFHRDGLLIHVKRHSSGAASVNHVFTQAKLYAHAFSADALTRKGMRDWIDNNAEPENVGKDKDDFKAKIPELDSDIDEKKLNVVLCILSGNANLEIADLPFMTQYELMLAHRYLTHDRKFKASVTFRKVDLSSP